MSTSQTKNIVIARMPATPLELWLWVYQVWGVRIPRISICQGHCSPFEAFQSAYFAVHPVEIWKGSRGLAGKSYTLATLGLTEAVTLGAKVNILGGSAAQSLNVHEHMDGMWYSPNAPKHALVDKPTKFETKLKNKGHIRALMASSRSVRGPHPQRLRLDEIDEMELEILDAAMGMPMPTRAIRSNTVMSSTHQYPDQTMTAMLKRARDKGWPVREWCHVENVNPIDGWLTQDVIDQKKAEVSKEMWRVEYELGEPSIEGRAIDHRAVKRLFNKNLGMFVGGVGETLIFQDPIDGVTYVTGVDWGRKRDYTVIDTFRTDTWERVAWLRVNKESWPDMVRRAESRLAMYPGFLAHDATGLGDVVASLFSDTRRARKQIEDIVLVGNIRATIFSEFISAVEQDTFSSPYIEFAFDEMLYCRMDDLFRTGQTFHPPDSVVAASLAWYLRSKKRLTAAPIVDELSKPASGWEMPMGFDEAPAPIGGGSGWVM